MPKPEILEFAKVLVEHVRDQAIRACDMTLDPAANYAKAKRWRDELQSGDTRRVVSAVIPDCVDATIFYLLQLMDNDQRFFFASSNGRTVDLMKDGYGEMAGWYGGGSEGWITRFSKERFVDDLAYLDHYFDNERTDPPNA